MLKQVWCQTHSTNKWKPKVTRYEYSDGSIHYSFDDGNKSHDITKEQAYKLINDYKMLDITAKMKAAGWLL